eukprot:1425766-Heterocapsa_arctica.AAC.1
METMTWDMETILLYKEINEGRTCTSGQTIAAGLLCHKNACITCMAIIFIQELHKYRSGTEAAEIIELYKLYKTEIAKMSNVQ